MSWYGAPGTWCWVQSCHFVSGFPCLVDGCFILRPKCLHSREISARLWVGSLEFVSRRTCGRLAGWMVPPGVCAGTCSGHCRQQWRCAPDCVWGDLVWSEVVLGGCLEWGSTPSSPPSLPFPPSRDCSCGKQIQLMYSARWRCLKQLLLRKCLFLVVSKRICSSTCLSELFKVVLIRTRWWLLKTVFYVWILWKWREKCCEKALKSSEFSFQNICRMPFAVIYSPGKL